MEQNLKKTYLPIGTVLSNRYEIKAVVGAGGFGIVYKAYDKKLKIDVAVKEFYVNRLSQRENDDHTVYIPGGERQKKEYNYRRNRFLFEAKNLAKFSKHASIVNVFDYFEENNTAYLIMEYLEGISLSEFVKQNEGKLDLKSTLEVLEKVTLALKTMHEEGILHLDIAPDNIFICPGDVVKVIDFGAAKFQRDENPVKDVILKTGYSPIEQYENNGKLGVFTDVYALGATAYYLLTGVKPTEATKRLSLDILRSPKQIDDTIPEYVSDAIMISLSLNPEDRFESVTEFYDILAGKKKLVRKKPVTEKKNKKANWPLRIIAALLALMTAVLVALWFTKGDNKSSENKTIRVWIMAEKGSDKEKNFSGAVTDYKSLHPELDIVLESFSEAEYKDKLLAAKAENSLPDIFESTSIGDELTEVSASLDSVYKDALVTGNALYAEWSNGNDKSKIPLVFDRPVALLVVNGPEPVLFEGNIFIDIKAFVLKDGTEANIALDENAKELWLLNKPEILDEITLSRKDYIDLKAQVILTSSSNVDSIKEANMTVGHKTVVWGNAAKISYDLFLSAAANKNSDDAQELIKYLITIGTFS